MRGKRQEGERSRVVREGAKERERGTEGRKRASGENIREEWRKKMREKEREREKREGRRWRKRVRVKEKREITTEKGEAKGDKDR